MRVLRLLALAAALVVPAAAAHAQYGVYVGPTAGYAIQANYGWVPAHWVYNGYGRVWVPAHRVGGYDRGFYGYEHRWGYEHGWDRGRGGWHHDRW